MASDSSAGFHHDGLFKLGGATTTSSSGSGGCEFISCGGGSMNFGGNERPIGRILFGAQNSPDSSLTHVLDSFPGLKHDTGFAVEWSIDEQYKLEEGLAKYASETNIAKYIKIAASIRDKTVRDVALRCRWMMRKRRKQEHPCLWKNMKDQKEKLAEPALKNNRSSASSVNGAPYSSSTNHHQQFGYMLSEVLSGTARRLVEENSQAFEQISVNLSTHKYMHRTSSGIYHGSLTYIGHLTFSDALREPSAGVLLMNSPDLQQNIDLFFRVRNNIITILNSMAKMPGIMSQMPPLPVFLNEELTSSIFPPLSQPVMFSSSSLAPVKQEPGY